MRICALLLLVLVLAMVGCSDQSSSPTAVNSDAVQVVGDPGPAPGGASAKTVVLPAGSVDGLAAAIAAAGIIGRRDFVRAEYPR